MRKQNGLTGTSCVVLAVLLIAPWGALWRMSAYLPWLLLAAVSVGISGIAAALVFFDKRQAEAGQWRTPESTLHLAELFGGWPGAFLAQRIFRHKTAKRSYQVIFWLIALIHQYVAIDFLLGWRIAAWAKNLISQT